MSFALQFTDDINAQTRSTTLTITSLGMCRTLHLVGVEMREDHTAHPVQDHHHAGVLR